MINTTREYGFPEPGTPLAISRQQRTVVWRAHGGLRTAPLLDNGLVAWSRTTASPSAALGELARLITGPHVSDRVNGTAPSRPVSELPQPTAPLLIKGHNGEVYWFAGPRLMHCPLFDDGIVGWGYATEVTDDADIEAAQLSEIAWTLRLAAHDGATTEIIRPPLPAKPGVVTVLTDGSILRDHAHDNGLLLNLRSAPSTKEFPADAALTPHTARALAASLVDHPDAETDSAHVRIRHAAPDNIEADVLKWRPDNGIIVLYDAARRPGVVGVRTAWDRLLPMTAQRGRAVAAALLAARAHADRALDRAAEVRARHQGAERLDERVTAALTRAGRHDQWALAEARAVGALLAERRTA